MSFFLYLDFNRNYWNKNEDVPSSELEALMSHLLPDISFLTALACSGNWETGGSAGGKSSS